MITSRMRKAKAASKSKAKLAWTKMTPTKEGYYWYRDADREVVLHVFESFTPGYWQAWDWKDGRLNRYSIMDYSGEWYGPLTTPK